MPSIIRIKRLRPASVLPVVEHLDEHVGPHLTPDVSAYAKGRTRAWLQLEAPLGPSQPWRPGLDSLRLWPFLQSCWRMQYSGLPDLGLAIHGNIGIEWHRDATYACNDTMIVNLGSCLFEIDDERDSPPGRPERPLSIPLFAGELVAFDCKHQHRVLQPAPRRWSVVLWQRKTRPTVDPMPVRIA